MKSIIIRHYSADINYTDTTLFDKYNKMELFTEFTPQMTGVDLPYGVLTKNVSRMDGKCVYRFLRSTY